MSKLDGVGTGKKTTKLPNKFSVTAQDEDEAAALIAYCCKKDLICFIRKVELQERDLWVPKIDSGCSFFPRGRLFSTSNTNKLNGCVGSGQTSCPHLLQLALGVPTAVVLAAAVLAALVLATTRWSPQLHSR